MLTYDFGDCALAHCNNFCLLFNPNCFIQIVIMVCNLEYSLDRNRVFVIVKSLCVYLENVIHLLENSNRFIFKKCMQICICKNVKMCMKQNKISLFLYEIFNRQNISVKSYSVCAEHLFIILFSLTSGTRLGIHIFFLKHFDGLKIGPPFLTLFLL